MSVPRRPPLQHPLAPVFERAVDSLGAALNPETTRHYHGTVRKFLSYLAADHPSVTRLDQLRRDPHILGWMSRLRSQTPPLATASCINLLVALRSIFSDLAWTRQQPELAHLIRREDIPRAPQRLPRPLTPEQDQLLHQEFMRRNDLGANAFLLIRHTGMRIGECADLSWDCLRATEKNQWAIHVPLGKLKTERMVPVDASALPSFRGCDSFAPSTRCPLTGFCWHAPKVKMHWFVSCAITCIWSAMNSTCPHASFHTNSGTPTQRKCFAPASVSPS